MLEEPQLGIGHTFFDGIRKTLKQESLNTPAFKFFTVNPDTSESPPNGGME